MGLKITTQIGTDRGITKEAYVRIASYNIQKTGELSFQLELYMKQPEAQTAPVPGMPYSGAFSETCINREIGNSFNVRLTKDVILTRTANRQVLKDVVVTESLTTPSLVEGEPDEVVTTTSTVAKLVDEEFDESYTQTVPDLSQLEEVSVFAFSYGKLKEKLQALFGKAYVIDC